jgi:hypothetical protein
MQAGERAVCCSVQDWQIMRLRHAFLRVFVGKNRGACGVKMRVVVGMVEVSVSVDHVFQRRITEAVESLFEPRPEHR